MIKQFIQQNDSERSFGVILFIEGTCTQMRNTSLQTLDHTYISQCHTFQFTRTTSYVNLTLLKEALDLRQETNIINFMIAVELTILI